MLFVEAVDTSPCLRTLMGGAFDVGGRVPLTSKVPEEDFQLLWLICAPPVEVSSGVCLGTVVCLQDVEEASHVGPNFLHQAVSDGADCVFITLQKASDKSVVISAVGECLLGNPKVLTSVLKLFKAEGDFPFPLGSYGFTIPH